MASERVPLRPGTEEKASRALDELASSLGGRDVENPYMKSPAPAQPQLTVVQRLAKELKQNWWLWASVVFAVILIGGLFIFRNNLYDNATAGLPFLAVKESAAEVCAAQCKEEQEAGALLAAGTGGDKDAAASAHVKDAYDVCLAKCVASETKAVISERETFIKEEAADVANPAAALATGSGSG